MEGVVKGGGGRCGCTLRFLGLRGGVRMWRFGDERAGAYFTSPVFRWFMSMCMPSARSCQLYSVGCKVGAKVAPSLSVPVGITILKNSPSRTVPS